MGNCLDDMSIMELGDLLARYPKHLTSLADMSIENLMATDGDVLMKHLSDLIAKCDAAYYGTDDDTRPLISDSDYDALVSLNKKLEDDERFESFIRDNSPTNRVGSSASDHFAKIQHTPPCFLLPTRLLKLT